MFDSPSGSAVAAATSVSFGVASGVTVGVGTAACISPQAVSDSSTAQAINSSNVRFMFHFLTYFACRYVPYPDAKHYSAAG